MIWEFISILFGALIFFPFIVLLIILMIYRKRGISPATVLGQAADMTTPILFLSVYFLALSTLGKGSGVYISLLSVLVVITYAIIERRRVKEFRIIRLLHKTWRLYFLLLTCAYVVLIIGGVVTKILSYTH